VTSIRIPGSLRCPASRAASAGSPRKDSPVTTFVTAACLAAASSSTVALAQGASSSTSLPPLSVEAKAPAKKKARASKPATAVVAPAPAPVPQLTPEQKSANPYADPVAPYKVDTSASPKLTEPLLNTPKSVTVIPKEVLEDKAATSVREVARQTPGVTLGFAEGGNAFGDRIYIRGFDARGDIFVDGMRDPGNSSRETFAVEQIEILKGPAATIAGRGVTGGALNIITKKPNEEANFYNVSTMFGTDKTIRTTLDINQAVDPTFAIRANLLFHDSHVAGRDDEVQDERWGGLLAFVYKPTDRFKFSFDYYRYRTDGVPDWGVPFDPRTKLPVTETAGVDRATWYGHANPGRDFMKNDADIVTGTAQYKLSDQATLTSKTRVGRTIVHYLASSTEETTILANPDPATWTTTVHNPNRLQQADLIANQTDITYKLDAYGVKHTIVAGVEISREEVRQQSYTGQANQAGVDLFDPQPILLSNFPTGLTAPINRQVDTAAAYLLDTIKLSPQWYVNGGIRFDHFDREDSGPPNANPNNSPNASREDNLFNWNVGIVYKPIPIASFYAAYATSSNPVGSELDATGPDYGGLAVGTADLAPEKNRAFEIGTKWELFNRHLLATFAAFQTEKDNAREADPTNSSNPVTATGAYRVRGIEFGAQGKLTQRWSVYGGLVFMDTEVTKSRTPEFVGRRLANIPLNQFNLLTTYKLTDKLTVGGQAIYSGKVYSGVLAQDSNFFHVPDHWRFDLLSEYKFTEHFSAKFNVVNITNELYYDALYRNATPFAFVAPGRAAYVTLNWKY
jgi:catecholate siderophore receptor